MMGEVGAAIPDNQSDSPSANGEVNGVCKASEPMDVDTEEDSQISSENGISDASGENFPSKNIAISKAADDTPDSPQEAEEEEDEEEDTTSKPSGGDGDGELSTHSENSNDHSQKSNSSITNKDEIKENGIPTSTGTECPEQETDNTSTDSENTCDSQKPEDKPTEEVLVNGQLNNSPPPTPIAEKPETKMSDEIEIIESDDENKDETPAPAALSSPAKDNPITKDDVDDKEDKSSEIKALPSLEKSDIKSTSMQEKCEPMEVDSTTNGNTSVTITKTKPVETSNTNDDNVPVVIQSDSEGEYDESNKTINDSVTNGQRNSIQIKNEINNSSINITSSQTDDEIQEILSDKDDCVVIEDDDKKETSSTARKNNRQRKSVVKVRDFSAFGDDDIQEIVEDLPTEQPPAKRFKTSLDGIQGTMPQLGQITIKDARTLMSPFMDNAAKQTFQQQFMQTAGAKGTKEPTLVIIDTHQMLKSPQTPTGAQNLQKQNSPFPILPAGISAQGIFPVNIRPGLSPLSTNQAKIGNVMPQNFIQATGGSPTIPVSNPTLLPALTDDMFVLEAPSFIVPYIYEKPPPENLKEIVTKMSIELEKIKKEKAERLESKKTEQTENISSIKTEGDVDSSKTQDATKKSDEKRKKKKKDKNPDDSWDESDTSTDEEASDAENRTKVLIKEVKDDLDTIKTHIITPDIANKQASTTSSPSADADKKTDNYFESPLGKFFIDIGVSLVQEFVQNDLLRQQKRKRDRAGGAGIASPEIQIAINSLKSNLEDSRKRNEPFKFEMKRCEYCNFKSESALAMAHHYETPHMRQYLYKCNFCSFETRPPYDILFHMEACHNIKGRLEKAPSYHQCPNCPFEDNGKSKLARHTPVCMKKFRPEGNLLPPHDWEAPAKIPRIKPRHGLVGTATAYQAMAAQAAAQKAALASLSARGPPATNNSALMRSRGRPQTVTRPAPGGGTMLRNNQPMRPQLPGMVLPNNYQISGGQLIQVAGSSLAILPNSHSSLTFQPQQQNSNKKNSGQQPSISITPLPRQPGAATPMNASPVQAATLPIQAKPTGLKPGQNQSGGKASFVICEICDGYIKDLEQLRNHMQWMHKVKIHPKMIYNRPPLNCQKCQFRFFTDQGLERHLLGSHGLVTSSMQEAANKGRDAGRCPVCGRMYQWKLLNHVSRDHHMTLKPAHLSYKCTVCTATFGMYKQFENHVYTAHSTVAKKAMDAKKGGTPVGGGGGSSGGGTNSNIGMGNSNNTPSGSTNKNSGVSALTGGDSLLKPLKINDEITIIPQPATKSRGSLVNEYESHVID